MTQCLGTKHLIWPINLLSVQFFIIIVIICFQTLLSVTISAMALYLTMLGKAYIKCPSFVKKAQKPINREVIGDVYPSWCISTDVLYKETLA